jgi:biotin-(acetyl-CoA carboxylase) ligase
LALRWEGFFGLRGKGVRVEMTDHTMIGTAKGIDRDGTLIVEDNRGERHRIVAGDVFPLED